MKYTFLLVFIAFNTYSQGLQLEHWLRYNDKDFKSGCKIIQHLVDDTNFDGIAENILLTEDTLNQDSEGSVVFYIIQLNNNGLYKKLFKNNMLAQCRSCGGGASSIGEIEINEDKSISFTAHYGSRQKGEHHTTIYYNKEFQKWEVRSLGFYWYDGLDPDGISPGANGSWNFESNYFKNPIFINESTGGTWEIIQQIRVNKYFKVISPKTYFKASDNINNSTNNYLIQGDFIECEYEIKDFCGCEFINKSRGTQGFLNKKDLIEVFVKKETTNFYLVTESKAEIYSSPSFNKKTTGYVIKGDELSCPYSYGGFLKCDFEKEDAKNSVIVRNAFFIHQKSVKPRKF
ncbi:hypothetical protein [Runella sp.]|uniref:hypothetical protein n=1 Tax=Runella sp. TaxID=1960881 RepID=UPI003D121CD9